MEKQVLSIEQMQKLKELGVDTSKASMAWVKTKYAPDANYDLGVYSSSLIQLYDVIPTFTLQDIIELMPEQIDGYPLTYDVLSNQFYGFKIGVHYMPKCEYNSVIDFAFDIICALAEKGYLKDN